VAWPDTWLVRTFVHDHRNVTDQKVRYGYARLEAWVSILLNLLLGTLKLVLGLLSGNIALTADAAHTYGDMASSVVLMASMRIAAQPPDEKHPHGHGRAEVIGTLALAALLIITAVEFAHPAIDRLLGLHPLPQKITKTMGWGMIPVLIVFWAVKEWMARFSSRLGERISSEALIGDAQHHRSDALATLLVVFSFVGTEMGYPRLDGLFGLGVVGFIGWAGLQLARKTVNRLMGEAPSEDLVTGIVSAAASIRGVRGVHGVDVHDYGSQRVTSLHVDVAPEMSAGESHRLATLVEEALRRRLGLTATVHIEAGRSPEIDSRLSRIEDVLQDFAKKEKAVLGFHAIHVTSSEMHSAVDLHLTLAPGLPVEDAHRIEHELAEKLILHIGVAKINVHCEPAGQEKSSPVP
jgi:cation diffusion facilitator family transporter